MHQRGNPGNHQWIRYYVTHLSLRHFFSLLLALPADTFNVFPVLQITRLFVLFPHSIFHNRNTAILSHFEVIYISNSPTFLFETKFTETGLDPFERTKIYFVPDDVENREKNRKFYLITADSH